MACRPWRSIKLGKLCSVENIRTELKMSGVNIDSWASSVMEHPSFVLHDGEIELNLVRVTLRELGFKESAPYVSIYAHAAELGLKLCPAEVGPLLRMQYLDQPEAEKLYIAMMPLITADSTFKFIFWLDSEKSARYLRCEFYDEGCSGADAELVFVLPSR